MSTRAWLCAVVVAAFSQVGCLGNEEAGQPENPAPDPPRLVINRSIGDVHLRMARAVVERRYGNPAQVRVFRAYFPVGTKYERKKLIRAVYRVHRGILQVDYVDEEVKSVKTTSTYYRSASDAGVGAHLPRDRCMRLDETGHVGPPGCKTTWRGFTFDGECLDAWLTSMKANAMTLLYMHRGRRIETVEIGDPEAILPCF